MHNVSYYSTKSGNNMPACYGGFIGREHNGNRNDSRVIRTNEEGHLLYNISGYDFDDSGNYIGSIPWSTITNSLVKDQTKYSGNFSFRWVNPAETMGNLFLFTKPKKSVCFCYSPITTKKD